MKSLFLRNLFFILLQPGVVAGLIPYLLWKNTHVAFHWSGIRFYLAVFIITVGMAILFHCSYLFASTGGGTISPIDPTRKLVTVGLYRFSRNPMYMGVITILSGEVILSGLMTLGAYAISIFAIFHLYIVFAEEPRLARDFGEPYKRYHYQVRRWV
jgi:protein-S-isoprenylcysteine O-methyltransferase Ste14